MRHWYNSDLDNTYISADAYKNLILETYNVFLDVIYTLIWLSQTHKWTTLLHWVRGSFTATYALQFILSKLHMHHPGVLNIKRETKVNQMCSSKYSYINSIHKSDMT